MIVVRHVRHGYIPELVVSFTNIYSFNLNRNGRIGCSKYSARTANAESETIYSLIDDLSPNRTEEIFFNQNIVVNHDGSPTFGAKIIFSEFENLKGNRYEIGTLKVTHFTH